MTHESIAFRSLIIIQKQCLISLALNLRTAFFFLQKATGGQTDSEDEDLEDEDQSEDEDSKSGLESLVSGGCIRTKHA